MITVKVRGFLIILYVVIGLIIFALEVDKHKNFKKRCLTFIKYSILGFPLIDMNMVPSELNIKVFEFLTLVFFILNIQSFITKNKKYLSLIVLFFFISLIITGINSYFISNSLYATFKSLSYFLFFIIASKALLINKNLPKFIFNNIALWAIVFFGFQIVFGINFSLYNSLNEVALREFRFTSFSQDPQKMSQVMYMLAIIFLGNFFIKKENILSRNSLFFILTLVIGLSSGSKASLIGFVISLIILYFFRVSVRSSFFLLTAFILVFLFIGEIQSLTFFNRMLDVQQSLEGRVDIFWLEALNIFYTYPLLGVGHGNFAIYVFNFADYLTYGNDIVIDQPESGYILWLVETGIIGFIFYISLLLKIMIHSNKTKDILQYKLALIVWMVGFISVYSFTDVKVIYLLFFLAALILSDKNGFIKKIKITKLN